MQGLTENHTLWRGLPVKKILFITEKTFYWNNHFFMQHACSAFKFPWGEIDQMDQSI